MKAYYGKFICPSCHKQFREKVYVKKNDNFIIECAEGLLFEAHVHCPYCEQYIPYKDKRN